MQKFILASLLVFFSMGGVAFASQGDIFEVETEGSYQFGAGSSVDLAKKVAFFNAKRIAVELAGRYLSRNSRIRIYELKKDEIYSLVAKEVRAEILEQKRERIGENSIYRLRIRARVEASDFIKAEMKDARLQEDEANESYQEEMEQSLSSEIDPGKDIAKAYRLLREEKWRLAIIYLNHLENRYPNWDRIYMAKAIAYYVLHEPVFMKKSLNKACHMGNQIACDDLRNLKKLHEHDFDLSILDEKSN